MSLILILVGTSSYYTYMYVMWTTKYVHTVLVVYRSFENGRNKSRGKSRPTFTSRVMYSHVRTY